MTRLEEIAEAVVAGDGIIVGELTKGAIGAGIDAKRILAEGLRAGIDIAGARWRQGELFIPEVLLAVEAMNVGMDLLRPFFSEEVPTSLGKVVLGTVKGDIHDIGKNLVATMLEGGGFEVQDLGVDVGPERFVEAVRENRIHILGMSALLSTTAPSMRHVIDALAEAGVRDQVKILVGGAVVTPDFARTIGADGYAPDAGQAVEVARTLVTRG